MANCVNGGAWLMWGVLMGEKRGGDDELRAADGEAEVGLGQSSGEGGCCQDDAAGGGVDTWTTC